MSNHPIPVYKFTPRKKKYKTTANTHVVYIILYSNENGNYDVLPFWKKLLINAQEGITGSYYSHIVVAVDDPISGGLMCYDVLFNGFVKKQSKSGDFYKEKTQLSVTKDEYDKLMNEMEYHVKRKTPFNMSAFWWNFLPMTRWYSIRGEGLYCAQFVSVCFEKAGIINLDGYIETDGYINCFCCCFFRPSHTKVKKQIRIPRSYEMTVKTVYDVVHYQNRRRMTILSKTRNINEYSEEKKKFLEKRNDMGFTSTIPQPSFKKKKKILKLFKQFRKKN